MLKRFLNPAQLGPAEVLRCPVLRLAELGPLLAGGVLCVCSGEVGMALDCRVQVDLRGEQICAIPFPLNGLEHPSPLHLYSLR